jgi:hypothetical protein
MTATAGPQIHKTATSGPEFQNSGALARCFMTLELHVMLDHHAILHGQFTQQHQRIQQVQPIVHLCTRTVNHPCQQTPIVATFLAKDFYEDP